MSDDGKVMILRTRTEYPKEPLEMSTDHAPMLIGEIDKSIHTYAVIGAFGFIVGAILTIWLIYAYVIHNSAMSQASGIVVSPIDIVPIAGDPGAIACTMEAKICPDGSAVSRGGPNCDFAQCPSIAK